MGAKITGAGTSTIQVEGVTSLSGARVRVIPDRIETGTYAMAVAMTGGDVLLEGAQESLLSSALDTLRQAGAEITETNSGLRVVRNGHGIQPVDVTTDPFPGFPTDLQAQFMGLMTKAKGTSRITETIFENRFMHVQELARLGAKISPVRPDGNRRRRGAPERRTGDGDGPARIGFPGDRGPRRRGRNHGQPRLSLGSRLRAAGRKTVPLRRVGGTHQWLIGPSGATFIAPLFSDSSLRSQ